MAHLLTFAKFVKETLDTNEIITKAAAEHEAENKPKTEDEKLDKIVADKEAQDAADKAAAKQAAVDPKAPASEQPGRKLVKGGTEVVAQWQEKLVKAGYKINVDGAWGKNTQEAYTKYMANKHGADHPRTKKAEAGAAPEAAKYSPGAGGLLNFLNTEGDKKKARPNNKPSQSKKSTGKGGLVNFIDNEGSKG